MTDVIIVCGGTGGHLSPGIALAEELINRGYSCKLCISKKSIDTEIVKKYKNLSIARFSGKGFSGSLIAKLFSFIQLLSSLPKIFTIIISNKPKLVVLFGGYLSVGFGFIGFLLNIKIILHESNGKVGKAIRLLKNFAYRVYLPLGVSLKGLKKPKLLHAGYPLRREIVSLDKNEARKRLELSCDGLLLVIIGGSQGAQVLNKWVIDHFEKLMGRGISIYCITGLNNGLESYDISTNDRGDEVFIKMVPFSDNMAAVLSAADLVITRAGAGAVAEITCCKVPSILIPYPYATDNHQLSNARIHEGKGGGIVLNESNIDKLYSEVESLISNNTLLEQISINLMNFSTIDATKDIVDDLEFIINK